MINLFFNLMVFSESVSVEGTDSKSTFLRVSNSCIDEVKTWGFLPHHPEQILPLQAGQSFDSPAKTGRVFVEQQSVIFNWTHSLKKIYQLKQSRSKLKPRQNFAFQFVNQMACSFSL